MALPNDDQPPDQRAIVAVVAFVERFESAVENGENFMAFRAAHGIVRTLKRFLPYVFPMESSQAVVGLAEPHLPVFLSDPVIRVSKPDPHYTEVVQASVHEFKEAISRGDLKTAVAALKPTGLLAGVLSLAGELRRLESDAARMGGSSRLRILPRMAKIALLLSEADKAERYAAEAIALVIPPQTDPFETSAEAIHDANMVAGVLALRRGDIERARQCLLASAHSGGYRELVEHGPNLTLADELLKRGEREVVVEYFEQLRVFWTQGGGLITKWLEVIRSGGTPEFDLLFLTI